LLFFLSPDPRGPPRIQKLIDLNFFLENPFSGVILLVLAFGQLPSAIHFFVGRWRTASVKYWPPVSPILPYSSFFSKHGKSLFLLPFCRLSFTVGASIPSFRETSSRSLFPRLPLVYRRHTFPFQRRFRWPPFSPYGCWSDPVCVYFAPPCNTCLFFGTLGLGFPSNQLPLVNAANRIRYSYKFSSIMVFLS